MRPFDSSLRLLAPLVLVAAAGVGVGVYGCSNSSAITENVVDAGNPTVDSGSGGDAGPDCFNDPKTYEEIINACTDAVKIDKKPTLPLLLADGGLPPLP